MKRITTFALILMISTALFSQQRTRSFLGWRLEKDTPILKNEVKLNLATTVITLNPEISYEHIFHEDFAIGASASISLDGNSIYPTNFAIMPYARWYLGGNTTNMQKYGTGLFVELNSSVHADNSNDFGAGLGLAVGWKALTKNNWVAEVYTGLGRDFILDSAYPRLGITVGRRF